MGVVRMVLIAVGISLGMEYMSIVARTRTSAALSMVALSALVNRLRMVARENLSKLA